MSGFYPFLMSIFFSNQSLHPLVFMGLTKPSLLSSNKKSNKKTIVPRHSLYLFPMVFLFLYHYFIYIKLGHFNDVRSLF